MSTVAPPVTPTTGPEAGRPLGTVRNVWGCIGLYIITLGIYSYFWVWWTQREVKAYSGQGVGGPVGFLLYFVFAPITFFLVPAEVGKMYQAEGETPPVSPWWGLWFLLPIIGHFVWFPKVQGALNSFWEARGGGAA